MIDPVLSPGPGALRSNLLAMPAVGPKPAKGMADPAPLWTTIDEQRCSCQRGGREAHQHVNPCGGCVLHESDNVWRERDPKPQAECCLWLPFGLMHQCCYGGQRDHAAVQPSVPCRNIPDIETENPWHCDEQGRAA